MGWTSTPVVLDYFLTHLGFFALLPVLPLVLERLQPSYSPWFLGAALFAFNFANRGASLFLSGQLQRMRVRSAMCAGLLTSAAGFALLPYAPGPLGVLACLILAGTGISTNGLMARVFVALSLPDAGDRNTVFSSVQIAVNVSAALGPLVANVLLADRGPRTVLFAVAAAYAAAAWVVVVALPASLAAGRDDVRPPLRLALLREVVTDPVVRKLSLVTVAGSLMYGQLFSAVVLHVVMVAEEPLLRGSFFVANALIVVAAQMPVALWTKRRLAGSTRPSSVLLVGTAGFAASFAVFGTVGATVVGTFAAVAVFSLAETIFTPVVNTAFGGLPGDRPLIEAFNLRQVSTSVGEATGAFAGGALFPLASDAGFAAAYWLALAGLGLLVLIVGLPERSRNVRKVQPCASL